jgi:hypothetical protein
MRRAQQQVIVFPAFDSASSTGALKSGLTLLASDVQIIKDGGSPAAATNAPAEIGSTGMYALALTAAEANCGYLAILVTKAGMRPQPLYGAMSDHPAASVVADAGNTATTFVTDLAGSSNDFYAFQGVRFTTGALAGQTREIESYNGTTKAITLVDPLTSIPAAGSLFELIDS